MKKTLVALAALASVSAFAQSTVEIYGTLDIGQIKLSGQQAGLNNSNASFPTSQSGTALANTFARQGTSTNNMGFRGREDLGGGMYAGFDLQTGGLDASTGSPALAFSRENNLQIGSSAWGQLKIGRSSATVCAIGCSFDYNYIGSGNAAAMTGLSPASFRGSSRRSDQIEFKSKDMNGLTVYASLVQRGDMNADGSFTTSGGASYTTTSTVSGISTTVSDFKNMTTLGAVYVQGPLRIAGFSESASVNSPAVRPGTMLAVEYNFGPFTANVQSNVNPNKTTWTDAAGAAQSKTGQYSLSTAAGTTTYGKGTVLGVKAPIGNTTIGVQHANNSETRVKATELFAQYALSKRTTLYAYSTRLTGTSAVSATAVTSTYTTVNQLMTGAIAVNPTIYAFGVRHTF